MSDPVLIRCPHCDTANRVPGARLSEGPKCGRCHRALFSGKPLELDSARFDRFVSSEAIPLLVDFWAPWCSPCHQMAPAFAQAAGALEPYMRLAKVNTESDSVLAGRYGIRSIPTLILFKEGKELARQSGAMGARDIEQWARAALHGGVSA